MSDVHVVARLSVVFCVISSLWKATLQVLHTDGDNKAVKESRKECSAR